jgi:hypothetical protein
MAACRLRDAAWGGLNCSPFWCCSCHVSGGAEHLCLKRLHSTDAPGCPLQPAGVMAIDEATSAIADVVVTDAHQCEGTRNSTSKRSHGEAEDNGNCHGQQELGLEAFFVQAAACNPPMVVSEVSKHCAQAVTACADGSLLQRSYRRIAAASPQAASHQDDRIIDEDARKTKQSDEGQDGELVAQNPMAENTAPTMPKGMINKTAIGRQ